ncbi:HAMP domain-containing sensor histidine kinase [Xylophilus sp. GOD-11R]|uniref:sensor histidine kinase n=1 Tax=Xylophilus sp. GOD-11R TaxID=3089814 RepID=UPI00298CB941|nr:HAMP domain-containing sensor histidine kinase [Xylophilus sp. GOD-11R]WPB55531.1 HAMP domain-containing sensor histidine kinase [Xylophilus sp. GOD-11R]
MNPLRRLWSSVAFRLALNYGALVVVTMAVILTLFYLQTVGVLQNRIDRHIEVTAQRLLFTADREGVDQLARDIQDMLRDGMNTDTEIYLLLEPDGARRVGNVMLISLPAAAASEVVEARAVRDGRPTDARLKVYALPEGRRLLVGSDLLHQREIERLIVRAIGWGALVALLMTVGGALIFRQELEKRIGGIRRTIVRIEAGDLGQRIPISSQEDEFARLNREINGMLDQLQQLMDGVRHVSNTIAHDLRTPLTRILLGLRAAEHRPAEERADALGRAAREIEELAQIFDKLLGIAEVESGARRQSFEPVRLDTLAAEMVEFYEPVAEEQGARIELQVPPGLAAPGDRDLLAGALANLLDNALKYGGAGARVRVGATLDAGRASLLVQDDGPGVAAADIERMGTRFFRAGSELPGFGLGLASVCAVVGLHGGTIRFGDAAPGLRVAVELPGAHLADR